MKIFIPVWGEKHIKLMNEALLTSLSWYNNKRAVKGSDWIIATTGPNQKEEITKAIRSIDEEATLDFFYIEDLVYPKSNKGVLLLKALTYTIEKCLRDDNEPLLMATPDYIYGDGSIDNLKKIGSRDGCVSFAHMRVLPEVLKSMNGITNQEITGLGFKYPHKTWTHSEREAKEGITYYGGISWHELSRDLIAVRHYLPAPFYVNFREDDLEFFKTNHGHPHDGTFALWDHLWPAKLIQDGRLRYVGSSDAVTMIEITDPDENIPSPNPSGVTNKNDYCNSLLHNVIHKQFITIFRGR